MSNVGLLVSFGLLGVILFWVGLWVSSGIGFYIFGF